MTKAKRPPFVICDSKGRVVVRYATRQGANVAALSWAQCKRGPVSIKHGGKVIARATPHGSSHATLDEGFTPDLPL